MARFSRRAIFYGRNVSRELSHVASSVLNRRTTHIVEARKWTHDRDTGLQAIERSLGWTFTGLRSGWTEAQTALVSGA